MADTATTDKRNKVDHDLVVQLKQQGKTPAEIANEGLASDGQKVAVNYIYRILRDKGLGSGRSMGTTVKNTGANVASDAGSFLEKLQKTVDDADAAKAAEVERHTAALAAIDSNVQGAREMLEAVKPVADKLKAALEAANTENGDTPEGDTAETPEAPKAKAAAKK
jgi:hypothetical protein